MDGWMDGWPSRSEDTAHLVCQLSIYNSFPVIRTTIENKFARVGGDRSPFRNVNKEYVTPCSEI